MTRDLTRHRVRVLIVDDSVVIRRLITIGLSEDPEIEIVGNAANGVIALKMIPLVRPEVITLDIEMPEMDGLETLRRIRRTNAELRIIMFSTLSERGAAVTLEALSLGANDYVTKPANAGSLDLSMARLREELIPKIKQFFPAENRPSAVASEAPPAIPATKQPALSPKPVRAAVRREAVAIGVSTGGPTALAQVVPAIPHSFPLPIFIVQHMPPIFTRLLAERLQHQTKLKVFEAQDGMAVEPGTVYLAPGDYHMRVVRSASQRKIVLDQSPPRNFCRPAVDVLFSSIADAYGASTVAVVLTGMGQDGCAGAERLHKMGAWVIAQDERSSVVWGMPGAVAKAGIADVVADLNSVVPEILRQCP